MPGNRQLVYSQPSKWKHMKDDVSTRKFTVASEHIKEYQFCTILPKGQRNGAPKYQTILLVSDEHIEQPYLLKGTENNDDYFRKNDAFEREGKLWFLVPDIIFISRK